MIFTCHEVFFNHLKCKDHPYLTSHTKTGNGTDFLQIRRRNPMEEEKSSTKVLEQLET